MNRAEGEFSGPSQSAPASLPAPHAIPPRRVGLGLLTGCLFGLLAIDQLLLWRFVDFAPLWSYAAGAALAAGVAIAAARLATRIGGDAPTVRRLGACLVIALLLYLLGGEGRIFYANTDWQVRDAVLHDMVANPWPFAYVGRGFAELLRAPLGMYLLPSLAGKALGASAADVALLLLNSIMLAIVLAIASALFPDRRVAKRALIVFLLFSGPDIVGELLVDIATGRAFPDRIEAWAGIRFSAHVVQAFWVPQHALAGWIVALFFLLWRDARAPLGLLLAAVPLIALWSPLALMGALPFTALAAAHAFAERSIRRVDILLPAAATALAAPGLLYLTAGGDSVGMRLMALSPAWWLAFEAVEVGPYLLALAMLRLRGRAIRSSYWVVAACLLLMPWIQIGPSIDFMMRATIPAIAVLSMLVAEGLGFLDPGADRARRGWAGVLAVCLFLGSFTAAFEIRRALAYLPPPPPRCTLEQLLDRYYARNDRSTYMAPVGTMPRLIRPSAPAPVPHGARAICWGRQWETPR